jgi:hypothetical protein
MAEAPPDDPSSSPDSSRPKRPPPTIDLEASEVTEKTTSAGGEGSARRSRAGWRFGGFTPPPMAAWRPLFAAGAAGAVAALLVIAAAWAGGWLGETRQPVVQVHDDAKAIGLLASRIDDLEARGSQLVAPDQASSKRLEVIEKSIASIRSELAGARAQSEKLASELDAAKSANPSASASADLAAVEERLSRLEHTTRTDADMIAQNAQKPADDTALRRLVVASMLNLAVRQGEPFTAQLEAARLLASDRDALKPLQGFATSGVPNPANLTRELLTLVPKLSPPPPTNTTGAGIVDRLQAGASKLVRIERTDATGTDRGAIVARITAAAVRNDLPDTRRELEQLSVEDRKPAQAWLDKARERDAALAASHQFVNEAMAALAKGAHQDQ